MNYLLCRNLVKDYNLWKAMFDTHHYQHIEAGLILEKIWHSEIEYNEIFFLFKVINISKAKLFLQKPDVDGIALKAGVIDGDFWFINEDVLG